MKIVARGFPRRSFHQKDQDERQEEDGKVASAEFFNVVSA
jgi:hypothetical protein